MCVFLHSILSSNFDQRKPAFNRFRFESMVWQRRSSGRALLTEPKLLILDEPTEGIQPNIIDQIGHAIRLLREEDGMSILLVEQYLDFCKEFGDSFSILERGRVAASGQMPELTDSVIKEFLTV